MGCVELDFGIWSEVGFKYGLRLPFNKTSLSAVLNFSN